MSQSDPKLNQLISAQNQLIARQREVQMDIDRAKTRLTDELERIQKDYGGKVLTFERIAEDDRKKLAAVTGDVERRRTDLEREEKSKKAA